MHSWADFAHRASHAFLGVAPQNLEQHELRTGHSTTLLLPLRAAGLKTPRGMPSFSHPMYHQFHPVGLRGAAFTFIALQLPRAPPHTCGRRSPSARITSTHAQSTAPCPTSRLCHARADLTHSTRCDTTRTRRGAHSSRLPAATVPAGDGDAASPQAFAA